MESCDMVKDWSIAPDMCLHCIFGGSQACDYRRLRKPQRGEFSSRQEQSLVRTASEQLSQKLRSLSRLPFDHVIFVVGLATTTHFSFVRGLFTTCS
jgi:hypothetical protein